MKIQCLFLCLVVYKVVQEIKYCFYWKVDVIIFRVFFYQGYKVLRGIFFLGMGIY